MSDYMSQKMDSLIESGINEREQLLSELDKVRKQLVEAIEVIKLYQESTGDTCRLDHHGYCQEHWLDKEEDCPNFRANKLLKSLEE